jgi:ketosteroid isomerase-like protein
MNNKTKMTPKETLLKWIDAFNKADLDALSDLYADNAINHQVANEPVEGKKTILEKLNIELLMQAEKGLE